MENDTLDYSEISMGIRYVLQCKHGDGDIYFDPVSTSIKEVEKLAESWIRNVPKIAERLSILKIKAMEEADINLEEEVLLWSKNASYPHLENIHPNARCARNVIAGTSLGRYFIISPFSTEVVKAYKNESRT